MTKQCSVKLNTKMLVLSNLKSRFGTIPTDGVIAGQAVAEAYFQAKGMQIKTAMKDLDCFVPVDRNENNANAFRNQVTIGDSEHPTVLVDEPTFGGYCMNIIPKEHYEVVGSVTVNEINTIQVRCPDIFDLKTIIDGFDLNITQIGYNYNTDELYLSNNFIEFCDTLILKVTNFSTPAGTILRLFKKSQYEGIKVDIDQEFKALSFALSLRERSGNFSTGCGLGESRYKDFIKYKDQWSKFIEVKEHEFTKNDDNSRASFKVYELIAKNKPSWVDEFSEEDKYTLSHLSGKIACMTEVECIKYVTQLCEFSPPRVGTDTFDLIKSVTNYEHLFGVIFKQPDRDLWELLLRYKDVTGYPLNIMGNLKYIKFIIDRVELINQKQKWYALNSNLNGLFRLPHDEFIRSISQPVEALFQGVKVEPIVKYFPKKVKLGKLKAQLITDLNTLKMLSFNEEFNLVEYYQRICKGHIAVYGVKEKGGQINNIITFERGDSDRGFKRRDLRGNYSLFEKIEVKINRALYVYFHDIESKKQYLNFKHKVMTLLIKHKLIKTKDTKVVRGFNFNESEDIPF